MLNVKGCSREGAWKGSRRQTAAPNASESRKAGLIEASVPTNATPDIHPQSEQYWGRRRQDIGHSYFKRTPQVRLGGRVGEGNDDDLMLAEKSDLLIVAVKLTKVSGAKGEMD